MEDVKNAILIALAVIIIILVMAFGVYAFLGFLDWIFADPFNWISDSANTTWKEERKADADLCRNAGGIPILDGMNRVDDCIILNQ